MKKIDDRSLAWKISLFLIASVLLAMVADFFAGSGETSMLSGPVFLALVAATFLSLVYWLLRNFDISREASITVVCVLLVVISLASVLGLKAYVVMSNSMRQDNSTAKLFSFWERIGYSEEEFGSFPASGGFQAGDMLIVTRTDDLKIGDVAVDIRGKIPVTHRIFFLNGTTVMTSGDAYPPFAPSSVQKRDIRPREGIYGKVWFVMPKGGILKVLEYCFNDPKCGPVECFTDGDCGDTRLYE
ncbi:MAG: hypothetical protein V1887_01585 [Candidatus Aenigmatarchaeota archaeon]